MRKSYKLIVFILLCTKLLGLESCSTLLVLDNNKRFINKKEIPPLTIVITDQETGMPLSDITVHYFLVKTHIHFNIFNPEFFVNFYDTIVDRQKLSTNDDGEITIPAKSYFQIRNEEITNKYFIINLDTDNNWIPSIKELIKYYHSPIEGEKLIYINRAYNAVSVRFIDGKNEKYYKNNIFLENSFSRYEIIKPFVEIERLAIPLVRNGA